MSFGPTLLQKRDEILALAQTYRAENLRVFGSVALEKDTPESDVDFLVSFKPGASLLHHVGLKQSLEELLERKVDLGSEKALHWYIRDRVLKQARAL